MSCQQRSLPRFSIVSGFTWVCLTILLSIAPLRAQTLVIQNQHNKVYSGLAIKTTTAGADCIQIIDSTNITIENSQIGPCGGHGISLFTSASTDNGIYIYDNYIHPETHKNLCCDYNNGIFLTPGVSNVTIQGNVIAYGESNIAINGNDGIDNNPTIDSVTVTGNFFLNPRGGKYSRGQNIAAWYATNIVVNNNYTLSSTTGYKYREIQEDSINFSFSSYLSASNNYITGGHSASGCGMIADEGANHVQFTTNELVNTGQCGIAIASGTTQTVSGNKVFENDEIAGGGNTAIYIWNQYPEPCGPVNLTNNTATFKLSNGSYNSLYDGGGCTPETKSGNTFNAAAWNILNPPSVTMPPPMIPPQPKNCVAKSPYSTQTGWPACM